MMSLSRSAPTGDWFRSTGSRYCPAPGSPSLIFGSSGAGSRPPPRGWVGWHWMFCSPISDCKRTEQRASVRNGMKAGSSIFSTTTARCLASTSSESIVPTLTPATFTSSPGITKLALSKIARTR